MKIEEPDASGLRFGAQTAGTGRRCPAGAHCNSKSYALQSRLVDNGSFQLSGKGPAKFEIGTALAIIPPRAIRMPLLGTQPGAPQNLAEHCGAKKSGSQLRWHKVLKAFENCVSLAGIRGGPRKGSAVLVYDYPT